MTETDRTRHIVPLPVGATMRDYVGHPADECSTDGLVCVEMNFTGDAAHLAMILALDSTYARYRRDSHSSAAPRAIFESSPPFQPRAVRRRAPRRVASACRQPTCPSRHGSLCCTNGRVSCKGTGRSPPVS